MSLIADTIGHCLHRGLTFAAFRRGGKVELWVSFDPRLHQVEWRDLDKHRDLFLVAPFLPHPAFCTALKADACLLLDDDLDLMPLTKAHSAKVVYAPILRHWSREEHAIAIRQVQKEMAGRDLEKVVLSRTKELPLDPYNIPQLFEQALKEMPEAFVCLLNCPEYGTWIGASPEMLLSARGTQVRVDSIAGTLPLKAAPERAEDWGAKEREEQELVTRSVLNTFLEQGLQGVNVTGPKVLAAAHVAHLHTIVRAECHGPLSGLVKALHPTPAVCGSPREQAMAAILEHEPHHRSLYAGFWGPWRKGGSTELYVNIRCMRAWDEKAVLYLGGGITAASDPEKEWAETEHKALTWQRPIEALRVGIS